MEGAGVPIECSKGEAGFAQHEINLRYTEALEMADRLAIYKNGAKEIAALAGRAVTFMAKWSRWTTWARRATSTRASVDKLVDDTSV